MSGLILAAISAAAAAISGFGARHGWWTFRTGFSILRFAAYVALGGALVSAIRWNRLRAWPSALGFAACLCVAAAVGSWVLAAKTVPVIHDVTTDTQDPPPFVALLPVREKTPNGAAYGGPEVSALQKAAYPDLAPLELALPVPDAFAKALDAAKSMGWEIASTDESAGRIEATATTYWFGFKDDVIVRVRSEGAGSRVDVRSASRVGKSDVGTNARRVRKYLRVLRASA